MIYDLRAFKCNKSPVKDREHASRIFVFIMILKRPPKIGPTHRLPCTVFRRYADFSEEVLKIIYNYYA